MDAQGQAPVITATLPVNTLSTPLSISSAIPAPIQVPLAGLEASTTPSLSTSPAAAPPLTDLTKNGDRPDGPAALENAADSNSENVKDASEQPASITNPLTNGSAIPPATQSSLQRAPPATLNADAVNAAGEAEHAARVEQEAKVESAILAADQVKQEQDDSNHQRQRTPLTDLSVTQTNATLSYTAAEQTPRSPPSPSSTSALSSVTVSAAPSVIAANHNAKDTKEDEEESSEPAVESDRKPRSTGGRSTARRAASNASLKEAAASSSSSSSTRRSDKPPSTSTATNGGRTRGASAQGQPQRQSSRSKTTTAASSASTSSNTRPRIRQRGSPDPKDGDDTTPGTRRSRRTRQSTTQNGRAAGEEEDESDDGDEGVTRCVCGNNDDETSAFMIQCETCKAWQHGPCVGFKHENETPDTYYCEQCRPDLHPSMTSRGKKHARSVSASSRPTINGGSKDEKDESLRRSSSRDHQANRDLSASGPSSVTAATSSGHPSYHRSRSSADAAIITSFLDTSQGRTPPPPASPGSPGSNQGSSDGGTKRPMYPATSHFAAPQNPKRRSTMNSRDSAAFDESILLATQRAFRESRAMAMEGGKGSSKARKRKTREDDDMEPVKEEDEDHSDRALSSSAQPEGTSQRTGAPPHADVTLDKSNIDPSLEEHHDEEGEGEDDGDEHDDMLVDANGASAPRKRRRRRGAGALFTAPNKKRAATSRSKKGAADEADGERNEDSTVKSVQLDDTTSATEDEANARKRKRDDANQDDGRPGRAASPTASHDTSVGSHSSSDKPLAQANKRRKASPSDTQGEADASAAPPAQSVTNILGSTLQVAIPTFTEDSAAPSPAASLPPGQGDIDESGKEQEHAEAITNGLLAVSSTKGKKAVDTDQEESTPAPTTQGDENAAAVANGKGIKQPNQYTYKRGGPGSRGGLKGSPSKRAALAAAAEARHGKHRDETPSTYEDWINQPPSWGIPDHLSHLSHLLPSQSPLPLQVTKFISSPNNSAAPSPVTPQGESGSAEQAADPTPSTPAITISSSLEPSAKIRFPSRRMSIAEMRKRAKSMLDYLARVQVDTVDRSNRNRALAAVQETILESELKDRNLTPPPSMRFNKDSPLTPQANSLIDDLSRQLNSFQEKFL